jgi:uncharacterized membrane protein (UPF0127 family)
MARHILFILSLMVMFPPGCDETNVPQGQTGLEEVTMTIGSRDFILEIADTHEKRQTGLMYRREMPANRGMIFVFPSEQRLGFWMKNTYLPLDIIFLSSGGSVVSIATMKPLDLSSTDSVYPARFAIELNAGMAAQAGVRVGDRLAIPQQALRARD